MRKYIAEFLGTMFLVVFGCGSALAASAAGTPSTLLVAFAFGLIIVAMAYSVGNVSGAHLNPAVSLAMLISKRMKFADFLGYIIAQFIGGIAGACILYGFFPGTSLGANGYGALSATNCGMWQAFIIEGILTFVFILAVLGVTSRFENKSVSGIVIGLTLTLVHILGIPFTGTSVNPARSFGPALISGGTALNQVWLFIAAPLVGAVLAALVYMLIAPPAGKGKVK